MTVGDSAITGLHVFSTGIGSIHTEHRDGTRLPQMWWVLFSRNWVDLPINVFVLEHPEGLILFDTGLDPAVLTNPQYVGSGIGRFFMRRLFRARLRPEETLTKKLSGLGFNAADVCKVVVSHLHFDHVGGIGEVPQADLLVSRNEWSQLSEPNPERNFIFREHVQRPDARWHFVDFEQTDDPLLVTFGGCYDVMSDGSLILLPTPGHTPGSISMLARIKGRAPVLLIGDLAYAAELLMKDQLPDTGDRVQLLASYAKVRGLKQALPELIILPSHDFAAQEYLSSSLAQQGAPADRSTAACFSVG